MKKFIIVLSIILLSAPIFAEDEVNLDINITEINHFNTGSLNFGNSKSDSYDDDEKYLKPTDMFQSIKTLFVEDFCKSGEEDKRGLK